jgi:hypothetical protein
VHRIVEVCYFEIYAKRLKLVIHTDARVAGRNTLSSDSEIRCVSLKRCCGRRLTVLRDCFALPALGIESALPIAHPDDQVRTQAPQKLYL